MFVKRPGLQDCPSLLTGAPNWPSWMEADFNSFFNLCRHVVGQGTVNWFAGDVT